MKPKSKNKFLVGIDTGTNTGIAIYCSSTKKLVECRTVKIHEAMKIVESYKDHDIFVFVEDARLATFGRSNDISKAQGAGSVKRDAAIWEDYLTYLSVPFTMKRPNKRMTKFTSETFKKITGYDGRTSSHSRDAAMLVFGM